MTAPAICRSSPASSPINLRRSFAAERTARAIFVPYEAEQEAIHEIVALRAQGRPLMAIAAAMVPRGASRAAKGGQEEGLGASNPFA
jgi:hypothetical protein